MGLKIDLRSEMSEPGSERLIYRRRHRLTHAREFQAAYTHGCRRSAGPLTVFVRPNGLLDHRLGLSVGRRVGGAIARNRVKRLLREAFRLRQQGFPRLDGGGGGGGGGFDVVIQVRPHRVLGLVEYGRLLEMLVLRARDEIAKRGSVKKGGDHAPG